MSVALPVVGVSELILEVSDLEIAETFYREVVGLPVVNRWTDTEGNECSWLAAGHTRIGLWPKRVGIAGGRGGSHVHYALLIRDTDYDTILQHLQQQAQDVTEHSFADRDQGRSLYVTDPDGNCVEFYTWDASGLVEQLNG